MYAALPSGSTTREVASHIPTLYSVFLRHRRESHREGTRSFEIVTKRNRSHPPSTDSKAFESPHSSGRVIHPVALFPPCRAEFSFRNSAFQPHRIPCQHRPTPLSPRDGSFGHSLSFIPSFPSRRSVIRRNQGAGPLSTLGLSSPRPCSQPILVSQDMPGASSQRTQIG